MPAPGGGCGRARDPAAACPQACSSGWLHRADSAAAARLRGEAVLDEGSLPGVSDGPAPATTRPRATPCGYSRSYGSTFTSASFGMAAATASPISAWVPTTPITRSSSGMRRRKAAFAASSVTASTRCT